jgi:hypothetical protein
VPYTESVDIGELLLGGLARCRNPVIETTPIIDRFRIDHGAPLRLKTAGRRSANSADTNSLADHAHPVGAASRSLVHRQLGVGCYLRSNCLVRQGTPLRVLGVTQATPVRNRGLHDSPLEGTRFELAVTTQPKECEWRADVSCRRHRVEKELGFRACVIEITPNFE